MKDKECYFSEIEKQFDFYPITPVKGTPRLNGITLHAPLTRQKVEASNPRVRVKNHVKFTLFAVNVPR